MQDMVLCSRCGDRIGVYEPTVVVSDGSRRTTSLAREPRLRREDVALLHKQCAEALAGAGDAGA